jgi:UDP-glucose 4-epimerase
MRALVTGGAGFIGSHLANALVANGADVVVLDDLSSGREEWIHPDASFIQGDVADPEVVGRAVERCELVFHEAAHRAVLRSVEHPLETDRANVAGTLTVLLAARDAGVRRVVYASSSSVYGGAEELPTPERAPLVPRSPYAVSKLAGEHYCRVFWELDGLETVALRYFNVYGPGQRPDSRYAAVIPLFIAALTSGRSPEVHGDGSQSRHFAFISEVVDANLRAAQVPSQRCAGRVYNIAGEHPYNLMELLARLEEIIGVSRNPVHTGPRPGDVRHTFADVSAAGRDLGYRPSIPFTEGLRRTVEWFAGERQLSSREGHS